MARDSDPLAEPEPADPRAAADRTIARQALITGVGLVSCLGEGLDAHWEGLDGFAATGPVVDTTSFPPFPVHPITALEFDRQIPKRGDQRQMEAWQRIGTYAAGVALEAAGIKGNADLLGRMDMIVAAMACDITAVASLQWSNTEAKHTFPWLQLSEHHHFYQHDGGFRPDECAAIGRWYSEQHAYLISQLQSVQVGEGTLLDESVIFFGSELQNPPSHAKNNMPFLLAGNGGGLRTNRYLTYNGQSHNDLLL